MTTSLNRKNTKGDHQNIYIDAGHISGAQPIGLNRLLIVNQSQKL